MGAAVIYPCGCSIERSMFGKRELQSVDPCQKHLVLLTGKTMEQLKQGIVKIQKEEAKEN